MSDSRHPAPVGRTDRRRYPRGVGLCLIDALIPREVLDHGPEWERRRARLIVLLSVVSLILPLVLLQTWATDWDQYGRLVLLSFPVAGLFVLFGLRVGIPLNVLGNIHAAFCYFGCMGLTLGTGGGATAALTAMVYLPLMALVLCGRRAGVAWAAAIAIGLGFADWMVTQGMVVQPDRHDIGWAENRFSIVTILALAVAGIGYAFASFQALAIAEADQAWGAIAASKERYRALSENAGDIVTDFDERLNLTYVSPNSGEILGWLAEELLERPLEALFHRADFPMLVENLLYSRQFGEIRQMPVRFRHREGRWIPLECSFNSYQNHDGEMHTVAIARDVSGLRAAEIAARHHERLASTGTLAAGMAHQINNPVGAILNGSELALMSLEDGDTEAVRKALETNVEQARRCGNIVRGLLQFAGQEPVKKSREDLVEIMRHGLGLTESYAHERGVELHCDVSAGDAAIEANAVEIEQVVVNLLRNAVEASPKGGAVEVALHRGDGTVSVEVRDEGRGVPDENLPHVFDPFFTTRIEDGGSGLGLSVAHGIVADHGGEMVLEPRPDGGTCVRFTLPAVPAPRQSEV